MIVHYTEKQQYELRLRELKIQDSSEIYHLLLYQIIKIEAKSQRKLRLWNKVDPVLHVYVRKLGRIGKLICKIYLKRAVVSLVLLCVMKHCRVQYSLFIFLIEISLGW